jgi:hypothetical protein
MAMPSVSEKYYGGLFDNPAAYLPTCGRLASLPKKYGFLTEYMFFLLFLSGGCSKTENS